VYRIGTPGNYREQSWEEYSRSLEFLKLPVSGIPGNVKNCQKFQFFSVIVFFFIIIDNYTSIYLFIFYISIINIMLL